MIKYIFILGILLLSFSPLKKETAFLGCFKNQKTDITQCVEIHIDNDFSYQPFGQLSFTEVELLNSIFKNIYREKCESGIGDENTSYSYSFYTDGGMNKYTFVRLYQKDSYMPVYAEITSNNTPIRIKKGKQYIGINYTKEKVAEILKINENNICDCFQIVDDEKNHNHFLYFENNLLKKIVLQQQIN
ncbi:MAG: hypothetical protein LAT51_10355 [Flavobacteriaceae bacterium]|nr:hypothetical protein [Flavobacteriaceae bacterium]